MLRLFFIMTMQLPEVDEDGRVWYKPNRYQLTDEGLNHDALSVTMPNFQARRPVSSDFSSRHR
jgi:hypothetical protein